ncbi:BolA family transcriptional regulator, general stress-responsive regulator [Nematocida homosporus]|uniref:BolA family transcriptional regulator, general stress-responsive regulator n=1 Tax=Nematocida homosporus TaxID=1912981 RepID=UPI00221EDA4C|nr:BolA family transcriptional regulator, general stress-responsive regulator [Nematocida homosporus]KAI5185591.1 BolA family transcriptional regulator, general stress-responsive regulator [Nematocida homosporus]
MQRLERITKLLRGLYPEGRVEIVDQTHEHIGHREIAHDLSPSGTHLAITVYDLSFKNRRTLDIHREINRHLAEEFEKGLHAASIRCIDNLPQDS